MRRKYLVKEYLEIVREFRSKIPELTISTDIIVGYPGETDMQFTHSLELIEKIRPNIVNITRFSARPGTPAAKLENKLPGGLVKSRSRTLTKLRFRISQELNAKELGRSYKILVAERVKPGSVLGRTDNYLPVVIKRDLELGSWVDAEIVEATDSYLVGELVE
jgi:tRNA A37 methylthiotransferase MiaB